MQGDWRIHFLGWHFFRREPWHWPPGLLDSYLHAPEGTAIGFTDSIPLVALPLKPFSDLLPATFQYLGLWLLGCFILQGVFGVLLARLWTPRCSLQLLSATLFVLMPTLLARVGHPALCAHWVILWALWLYLRGEKGSVQPASVQAALGLTAGLIHPYLAVMVLPMLGALAVKDVLAASGPMRPRTGRRAIGGFVCATVLVAAGWWASGLFTVSDVDNLASEGLGRYSMQLLSPMTPRGWSTLLPEATAAPGDDHNEGFQYFGFGSLFLVGVAVLLAPRRFRALPWRQLWPLLVVAVVFALYALSPRGLDVDRFALFRASARFFWPAAYLALSSAIAIAVTRLPWLVSFAVLFTACVLQVADLRTVHLQRHVANRSQYFHAHRLPLTSPVWQMALPQYRHMVLYPPQQCGRAPASFEWPAYLAGLSGLTINAGETARHDAARRNSYCQSLEATLTSGQLSDDTFYIVERSRLQLLRARSRVPLICSELDGLPICVTARSYERWRSHAPLRPI